MCKFCKIMHSIEVKQNKLDSYFKGAATDSSGGVNQPQAFQIAFVCCIMTIHW